MSRTPLLAGNWKMNLNHFEAIALVQKIAFSLPDKYYDKVDVSVMPPFTDLRSVQTLVDGDKLVAAKAAAAFRHGLIPIVCIGEHLEIRESGDHVAHCVNQLRGSLAGLTAEQVAGVVIAYEPVWAIGTGRVASAADAQEVCE